MLAMTVIRVSFTLGSRESGSCYCSTPRGGYIKSLPLQPLQAVFLFLSLFLFLILHKHFLYYFLVIDNMWMCARNKVESLLLTRRVLLCLIEPQGLLYFTINYIEPSQCLSVFSLCVWKSLINNHDLIWPKSWFYWNPTSFNSNTRRLQ